MENANTLSAQEYKEKSQWPLHLLHALYYVIMVVFLVFYMLPFWGTIVASFKTNEEIDRSSPVALPENFTLSGYVSAIEQLGMPMLNSVIVTVGGAAGSLILGSLCAYALTKFPFKGGNLFFILLVAATYLPFQAILIPLMKTMTSLNLYDNLLGLILAHSVFGTPMCTVMMRGYYTDVPTALINQARIDGNGPWAIYAKVVIPNTKIANITVFVFQCTSIWNEMLFALVLGAADSKLATIALNEMLGATAQELSPLMAGSVLLALPVLILYIFMGKFLIRGYMAGAVTAS